MPAPAPVVTARPAPLAAAAPPATSAEQSARARRDSAAAAAPPPAALGKAAPAPDATGAERERAGSRQAAELSRQLANVDDTRPPSLASLLRGGDAAIAQADRRLLEQLSTQTRQRWRRGSAAPLAQESAPVRQWSVPGTSAGSAGGTASLRLEPEGVTWTEPDGSRFMAPMSPEALALLRAQL